MTQARIVIRITRTIQRFLRQKTRIKVILVWALLLCLSSIVKAETLYEYSQNNYNNQYVGNGFAHLYNDGTIDSYFSNGWDRWPVYYRTNFYAPAYTDYGYVVFFIIVEKFTDTNKDRNIMIYNL
jgi:hypothetical protein